MGIVHTATGRPAECVATDRESKTLVAENIQSMKIIFVPLIISLTCFTGVLNAAETSDDKKKLVIVSSFPKEMTLVFESAFVSDRVFVIVTMLFIEDRMRTKVGMAVALALTVELAVLFIEDRV